MEITLTALHWIYLIGTIFVIAAMCMKRDVVLPCMIFTILSGFVASGSIADALLTEARALMFAWGEFGSLIVGIGSQAAAAESDVKLIVNDAALETDVAVQV